jgi:putative aldouronate transport system permease protein
LEVIAGYVLSRKVRIKNFLSIFILFTMMFSGGLVPTFMVIKKLGMVGTMWSLIIPGSTNAAFIFIMMNAFLQVPESTVEAAEIDGAGHFTLMFRIMLPQALSLTTVIVLNSVLLQWNSWYAASIYVATNRSLWPLQLWIKQIVAQNTEFLNTTNPDYNRYLIQYAVITLATYPILIVFPFFLKYIEKGVLLGGVKE